MVTIFKDIWSKEPNYITIEQALARIKNGKSKDKVQMVRDCIDKERANELKKHLPSVCFSGKFGNNRTDSDLIEHSGFLVLDFDNCDVQEKKKDLIKNSFVHSCWVSPGGNGVKALVKISEPSKHKEHFKALQEIYPEVDKSGINPSRVCYESFDLDIYFNLEPTTFDKFFVDKKSPNIKIGVSEDETFQKILKWLSNKGDAFRTGERNIFVFKLASACCRFGVDEIASISQIKSILSTDNTFSVSEIERTVKSAYKSNMAVFGSAKFDNEILTDKKSKKEVQFDESIYDLNVRPKDVIYGEDVKQDAINIFLNGFESAISTYIPQIDEHFKFKRGEITLLSGIGNYGKSTILKYLILIQVIKDNRKFAFFSPEDNPAAEFYHDLVEMYFGANCTPGYLSRPSLQAYTAVYDFISKHIFYIYPKDIAPTPEYIKERFLELIIKEKVEGCVIDPFNQLSNDYNSVGGRDDKYLEIVLSDFARFSQVNQTIFIIVAHPRQMHKPKDSENYPRPDVFDLAGGAMWNNKMDNILIYHRPLRGEDPNNSLATFSSIKIRRQKIVGKLGTVELSLARGTRRYLFNGEDPMQKLINESYGQEYVKTELEANEDFLKEPF
jgi:hypothetical protein